MDFDLQTMLDNLVLDNRLGILDTKSPIELKAIEFIDLLNSGKAYDFELNEKLLGGIPSYYHLLKYKDISFLGQSSVRISDM